MPVVGADEAPSSVLDPQRYRWRIMSGQPIRTFDLRCNFGEGQRRRPTPSESQHCERGQRRAAKPAHCVPPVMMVVQRTLDLLRCVVGLGCASKCGHLRVDFRVDGPRAGSRLVVTKSLGPGGRGDGGCAGPFPSSSTPVLRTSKSWGWPTPPPDAVDSYQHDVLLFEHTDPQCPQWRWGFFIPNSRPRLLGITCPHGHSRLMGISCPQQSLPTDGNF